MLKKLQKDRPFEVFWYTVGLAPKTKVRVANSTTSFWYFGLISCRPSLRANRVPLPLHLKPKNCVKNWDLPVPFLCPMTSTNEVAPIRALHPRGEWALQYDPNLQQYIRNMSRLTVSKVYCGVRYVSTALWRSALACGENTGAAVVIVHTTRDIDPEEPLNMSRLTAPKI